MCYDATDAKAEEAMETIGRAFVDLNELRVATELEVQDMHGRPASPAWKSAWRW